MSCLKLKNQTQATGNSLESSRSDTAEKGQTMVFCQEYTIIHGWSSAERRSGCFSQSSTFLQGKGR